MSETLEKRMEPTRTLGRNTERDVRDNFRDGGPAHELGLWINALGSFCQVHNHALSNVDQTEAATRDWASEVRITRRLLLRCVQLAHSMQNPFYAQVETLAGAEGEKTSANPTLDSENIQADLLSDTPDRLFLTLADALKEALAVCDTLLEKQTVELHTFASFGKMLTRQFEQMEAAKMARRAESHYSTANLHESLVALTRRELMPSTLGADLLTIFTELTRLLRRLEFINDLIKRDQPLKQTLPIFALIYDGGRRLMDFIEACMARGEVGDQSITDALDATNYAITMEFRKVYSQELIGVSALRQAPAIYSKIEIAHGLLNNCFQQSTIGLAQLFDPTLKGAQLFNLLQIKLEQSIALRRDLWLILQLVMRAERERDQRPVSELIASLSAFRDGSLHYLMYKDWEACERFIEEVSDARGALELTPVLNRFGAYLETLFNQVSMRSVLADHPFDHPALEDTNH